MSIKVSAQSWSIEGNMLKDNARALLEQSLQIEMPAVIDLSQVAQADTSAVALLLAWKRRKRALRFEGIPPAISSLSALYGVAEILDLA